MNTPSHAIVNLAILGKPDQGLYNLPIVIGGILPDIPIFVFFLVAKFIYRLPANEIWSKAYYEPFWQNIIATAHSIPLAALGCITAYYWGWKQAAVIFASMILHSLLDLPVHHEDAHRHFFPFSNYRLISPLSYWDPNHYGAIVAFVEILLVLGSTVYTCQFVQSWLGKGLMIAVNILYFGFYISFYGMRLMKT